MQSAVRTQALGSHVALSHALAVPKPCSLHTQQPSAARQQHRHCQQQEQQGARLPIRSLHIARAERTSSGSSTGSGSNSSIITDSDISFLGKLLVFSFAGAALIKYGSLAFELPFQPNAAVALFLVLGTPAAYSLFLLTKGEKQQ